MLAVCKVCDKEFAYFPSRSSGLYCSRECYHKHAVGVNHPSYKEKVKRVCEQCGREVLTNFSTAKTTRFCSKECRHHWDSEHYVGKNNPNWSGGAYILRVCKYCGKDFMTARAVVKRGDGKYCSISCHAKARQGIIRPRTQYHVCVNCGDIFYGKRAKRKTMNYFCSRKCMGIHTRGKNNPFYGKKFSNESLMKLLNKVHMRPNNPERTLMELMEKHDLPFRYVGGGDLIIGGKNPDFIDSLGKRKVIELFGNYWHSPLFRPKQLRPTMTYGAITHHYTRHGYGCLIIWEGELKNPNRILEKIREYVGGVKIALNVPR